ncbi:MAG: GreA/GreB family elongation factor [Deltaproteobacteria bacterium]|nr:GreA/GreB family elongation factor [Deltaproteobacteria bacterium]
MPSDHDLIITDVDLERLRPVVEQSDSPAAEALDGELRRAVIVPQRDVPSDVVTMNRDVVYADSATGVQRTVRVVVPHQADPARRWVSVLAPIGRTLLGLRIGQEAELQMPNGHRRIRVIELPRETEAVSELH